MSASETKHAGLNLGGTDAKTHAEAEHAIFGFWIFLMSDAVIFALLFATYGVMLPATAGGPTPTSVFKIGPTFAETLLLLTSSLTYGMASVAMKHGSPLGGIHRWLAVTLLLGLIFLAFEWHDFSDMAKIDHKNPPGTCPKAKVLAVNAARWVGTSWLM